MAEIQAKTFYIDVRVAIELNLCCLRLNKCGLFTDSDHMNWKSHIDQNILPIFTLELNIVDSIFLVKFVLQ